MAKLHDLIISLRKIREDAQISQEYIGAAIGLNSQSGVSRVESGKHSPTLCTLSVWADALGYEIVLKPKSS